MKLSIAYFFFTSLLKRDFNLSAFFLWKILFLAALSTAENNEGKVFLLGDILKLLIVFKALVLTILLKPCFRSSTLVFLIADFVIGMK